MDLYDIRQKLGCGKSIYDIPLRVTYYARVSTDKEEQTHSLTNQKEYYQTMIRENEHWSFVEGYVDEGISGTSVHKREAFLQMIEDAKAGMFDFIITKEISRFSRNTLDSIQYTQELLKYGVGILFQSDNILTFFPDAELRLTIMASIAQDEVRKISERVKFGFQRAIEKGVVLGNNNMWGYKKEKGRLIIVPEEAEIVQEIFNLYANEGKGLRTICKILEEKGIVTSSGNSLHFSTVRNMIRNPKYKGFYCGNKSHKYDYKRNERKFLNAEEWVIYKDEESVPPIVSEPLWEKANQLLSQRALSMKTSSYTNKYPYSGKIICGEHQTTYYRTAYRYTHTVKEVWQCKRYKEHGKKGCNAPSVYSTELDTTLMESCSELFQQKERITEKLMNLYQLVYPSCDETVLLEEKRKQQKEFMDKKDRLLELNMAERISDKEFMERNEQYNHDMLLVQKEIGTLEQIQKQQKPFETMADELKKEILQAMEFTTGLSIPIVDSLLEKAVVYQTNEKNKIRLHLKLKKQKEEKEFLICRNRGTFSLKEQRNFEYI